MLVVGLMVVAIIAAKEEVKGSRIKRMSCSHTAAVMWFWGNSDIFNFLRC